MPTPYCHPVDVLRRFDPTLSLSDLSGGVIGVDTEAIEARVRAASQAWDDKTGRPMRTVRVGSPGSPATYNQQDVSGGVRPPLLVDLEHGDILPLDPNAGDKVEIRVGRDSWRDVTDRAGDEFVLDNDRGQLRIFRFLLSNLRFEDRGERFVRLSYRAGGLGGARDRGGETALSSAITATDTLIPVDDASRLPYDGGLVFLPEPTVADGEYVRVTDVDVQNDELSVERGVQRTDATAHEPPTPVHYCPAAVRDAVAAHAASELARNELATPRSDDDDGGLSAGAKVEDWEAEWDRTLSEYSNVRTL